MQVQQVMFMNTTKKSILILPFVCLTAAFVIVPLAWAFIGTLSLRDGKQFDSKEHRSIIAVDDKRLASPTPSTTPHIDRRAKPISDRIDLERELDWRNLMNSTGLPDLKRVDIAQNDIEIRIWVLPGLFIGKTKCWRFSRRSSRWEGYAFVDSKFNGNITKMSLDAPSSGWSKWEAYVNSELTPTTIRGTRPEPLPINDAMEIIVEAKLGDDHAETLVTDGEELLRRIFKIIKSEFFNDDMTRWSEF